MSNFINPYNFVPLTSGKKRAEHSEEKYSGLIEYSLLTKSPLFIPDTSNDNAFPQGKEGHKSYDFFSYERCEEKDSENKLYEPIIPGSEIRGMFRSNYEILTESCMSSIDEVVLSKRTMETFKAGLLKKENDRYILYKSEDCLWRLDEKGQDIKKWNEEYKDTKTYKTNKFKEGEKLYFQCYRRKGKTLVQEVSKDKKAEKNIAVGYLIKGESSPKTSTEKHCAHIFKELSKKTKENKEQEMISVKEFENLKMLHVILDEYKKNAKKAEKEEWYKEYRKELEKFEEGKGEAYFPVYYSKIESGEKSLIYLSPACVTREVSEKRLKHYLKSFQPCDDINQLCPACELFGTLATKGAKSSRIRFSDLQRNESKELEKCYMNPVTLMALSSPKLNNMEFYLKRPNSKAIFWTYDYYVTENGEVKIYDMEIAGRKFYWHNLYPKFPKVDPSKQNITVRPLASQVMFKGQVFFEDISEKELAQLVYLINAGEDSNIREKRHGYKLGAGKPLGLGSVATQVDKVIFHNIVLDKSLERVTYDNDESYQWKEEMCEISSKVKRDFEKMTNFCSIKNGKNISYPIGEGQESGEEGYKWFTQNHKQVNRKNGREVKGRPAERKDMFFGEYMEAMNPELQKVKFVCSKQKNGNDKSNHKNNRK